MAWDPPVVTRDQLVLFSERLDEVLPDDHPVRRLVEVLDLVDWSAWEAEFRHHGVGRSPIHPRVQSGIILYGLLRGIRSSRLLEEALEMRLDFRWLAEGRSIDHSTLCRFRRSHAERLKALFVQVTLVARQAGLVSLEELAVDGTKIRSNNRRSAKYKTAELQQLKKQLEVRFEELVEEAEVQDKRQVGVKSSDKQIGNVQDRLVEINRAIEVVAQLEADGERVPSRLPTTDVESRVTKSKEGYFAPNYTPVNVVDTSSGFVVATDVIAECDEKSVLPETLDEIEETFGEKPKRLLGDTIFNHSSNLIEVDKRDIELYAPIEDHEINPAVRDDPRQPVPAESHEQLPRKKDGQLSKAAFIYDSQENSYYCPMGKKLSYKSSYTEKLAQGRKLKRHRYHASKKDCSGCPLFDQCIKGKSKFRRVTSDDAEELRGQLRQRMRTREGQQTYNRRMISERPFAVIKHLMGARQLLHRGLKYVRQEWTWLTLAHNLMRLINVLGARPGPSTTSPANP